MLRRVLYVAVGIVIVNLMLMAVMFVRMADDDRCDVNARGLVIWDDDRESWHSVSPPREDTELALCRGRLETELTVRPG